MSHCGTSSLCDHLDHCFVVFKHKPQSFLTRRIHVWRNKCMDHQLSMTFHFWSLCTVVGTSRLVRTQVSTCSLDLSRVSVNCDDQIQCQVRVYRPSLILHPRNDFWFCWTVRNWNFLLTHPTDSNKRLTSKNAQCSTWRRLWILKISCIMCVENIPSLHCLAAFATWQFCLYSYVWWMYDITRHYRLSHALVHLVIDRASFITNQRTSRLPIRAKHKHFGTIRKYPFDTSPTDFNSSSLKWWSSMHGGYFVELLSRLVYQLTKSFHTFDGMTSHNIRPWKYEDSQRMEASVHTAEILDSNMALFWHCLWEHSTYTWSRKDVGSQKSTSLFSTFHIGSMFSFFPANFCHPHTQIRIILFQDVQRDIPNCPFLMT